MKGPKDDGLEVRFEDTCTVVHNNTGTSELNIPRPNIQLPEYSGIFNENSRSKMGHFVNIQ